MLNELTMWLGNRGPLGKRLARRLFIARVSYYAKRGMIESAEIVDRDVLRDRSKSRRQIAAQLTRMAATLEDVALETNLTDEQSMILANEAGLFIDVAEEMRNAGN